ncbi:restriction endonuclease subunit S [Helicobacter mustelae]|uniref:Putative type I restriction-modification system S protein n=1 Tax=Helicobacter mustelae (strain ATCC 43772 / CCUG 25715 / CIP 103759 / LMG 18044 / NCTC 12198 / R85-136P) TaxID=679897 RepID=D3UHV0_HELM1|nr:restriction endonuclease subunit S [Helicobacter mustelae]CBG40073.1 putative type I restriction-modification system S protein [Helicobacter mustelae 12198]SQH71586.1 type I restriction-modification system S protein [Helicobacter mustelae]
MNSVEKLLQTLCPHGVEFRKLGEVCEFQNKKTLKTSEVKNNGKYPVINSGRDLYGYYHDFNNDGENITIASRGEYAGFVNYFNEKFFAGGLCYPYKVKNSNKLLTKFLYFYLKANESQIMENLVIRGSIPALNKADIETLPIPLPPLEVQREIVKILDTFTELNTELNTELKLRKKQYEYYRNWLLSFGDVDASKEGAEQRLRNKSYPKALKALLLSLCPHGVEFRKLGEVGEYIRGVTYRKSQEINGQGCGIKVLRANNITLSNHLNFEDIKTIDKSVKIRKEQYLKKNDILICAGSGSSEHIGKVAFIDANSDYVFGGFMGVIRIRELNSRFVYHVFTSNIFKQYLEKSLNTTTINNLNANVLQNFKIPLPPLEVQREIVKILDDFSTLTEDLSSGIPAEIAARKKQYEYYRDKLLTFTPLIKEGE